MEIPEIWKELPADMHLSRYEVSNLGRVRNSGGYVLNSRPTPNGYIYSSVTRDDGEVVILSGHKMVAAAFLPFEEGKTQIDHLNHDRADNRLSNLRRVTPSENNLNKVDQSKAGRRARPIEQLDEDENVIKVWKSGKEIAESLGLSYARILACCGGRTDAVGGFGWRYPVDIPTEEEVWKTLTTNGMRIGVSSLGRIKLPKVTTKGMLEYSGKYVVNLTPPEGKVKKRMVHTLVCRAFHGKSPDKQKRVNHLDGDLTNNRADNLEWTTHVELCKTRKPPAKPRTGRTVEQLTPQGVLIATFSSISDASRAFEGEHRIPKQSICAACKGKMKGMAGGYLWRYKQETP